MLRRKITTHRDALVLAKQGEKCTQDNSTETMEQGQPIVPDKSDSTVTQTQNQTTFEDTTSLEKLTPHNDLEKVWSKFNPFPEKPPMDILTRSTKIETVLWTSTSTFWIFEPLITIVGVSPLLKAILGDLNLVYGMYRYLRCGFKITIKLNSTPYHQGTIVASWIPSCVNDSNYAFIEIAPGNHGMILSASQQDQIEFHIPYTWPNPFWDLINYQNQLNAGPKFILTVMNALETSNGAVADQVPITIWIQLENIHVAGLLPTTYNAAQTASTTHTQTASNTNPTSGVVWQSQSGKDLKIIPARESKAKETAKSLSMPGPMDFVAPLVKEMPLLGNIIELGSKILSSLDKPLNDAPSMLVAQRNVRNPTVLTGVFNGGCLGSMPVTRVSKNVGMVTSDMTVSQYAQLPNWFMSKSVSTAGVVFIQRVHPCIYNNSSSGGRGANPDFLGFAAAPYAFWRGSIKYLFHFVGTAFYSCTFRIVLYHGLGLSKASERAAIEDGVGCYSRVITVRGDAWTEIQVPYLHQNLWSFTNTLSFNNRNIDDPYIMLEALTDVQGSNTPGAAAYYVNVFRAGGEDIEFAQLGNALWTDPPSGGTGEVVWKSQCSLIEKFSKPFDQLVPGVSGVIDENICAGDKAGTITDACKRFVRQDNGNQSGHIGNTYQTYPYPGGTIVNQNLQPLFWWGYGFAYWRGSMRLWGCATNANGAYLPTATDASNTNSWTPGNGLMLADAQSQVEAEIPYYSRSAYTPTIACDTLTNILSHYEMPAKGLFMNFSASVQQAMIAFGDDACYLHPLAPYVFAGGQQQSNAIIKNGLSIATSKVYEHPQTITGMKIAVKAQAKPPKT